MLRLKIFILLVLVITGQALYVPKDTLIVESSFREIDLNARVIFVKERIKLRNEGILPEPIIRTALPEEVAEKVSHVFLSVGSKKFSPDKNEKHLTANEKGADSQDTVVLYTFPVTVPPNDVVAFEFSYYIGRALKPLLKKSPLLSDQKTYFVDRGSVASPYKVLKQKTTFLVSSHVAPETYGVSRASKSMYVKAITTPVEALHLGEKESVKIYYVLNKHLGFFRSVQRSVHVSEWGPTFFHERYEFENEAVPLSHSFSRIQIERMMLTRLQRMARGNIRYPENKVCLRLEAKLPANAYRLEYYDDIGNISSSISERKKDHVALQLDPRYPVLGGWKADWNLEYRIPSEFLVSSAYLKNEAKIRYRVAFPLSYSIIDVFSENTTLFITLPQGSRHIKVISPHTVLGNITVKRYWGWFHMHMPRVLVELNVGPLFVPAESSLETMIFVEYDSSASVLHQYGKWIVSCAMSFLPFLVWLIYAQYKRVKRHLAFDAKVVAVNDGALDRVIKLLDVLDRESDTCSKNYQKCMSPEKGEKTVQVWISKLQSVLVDMTKVVGAVEKCDRTCVPIVDRLKHVQTVCVDELQRITLLAGKAVSHRNDRTLMVDLKRDMMSFRAKVCELYQGLERFKDTLKTKRD